jgi:hypothetical protein
MKSFGAIFGGTCKKIVVELETEPPDNQQQ